MAGSLNRVQLIGHLGADPEPRTLPSGNRMASLRLATSETWRDKASGERKERTEWHQVQIFNENLAKIAEQYLRKGAKAFVEGMLRTRKWTDKDGIDRYTTEVVLDFDGRLILLDRQEGGARGDRAPPPADASYGAATRERGAASQRPLPESLDDDIPF